MTDASTPRTLENLLVWWRIRKALGALQGDSAAGHRRAVETLVASGPRCWHGLRKIAFKEKGVRAVSAAKLLVDLGDAQGMFALLEQHSSAEVRRDAQVFLVQALREIGCERIEGLLVEAVRDLERRTMASGTWGLAVSIYALRVLEEFQHPLPHALLSRCVLMSHPQFDSMAACRAVFPFTAFTAYRTSRAEAVNDFFVGSSLSAVRRVAADFLIGQEGDGAFTVLTEAMAHPDPQVQYVGLYGLSRLRDQRALPLFQRLATNRRHPLCHDAQRAIEVYGTGLPDILTLVRGSQLSMAPEELLRAVAPAGERSPETLLRPSADEKPPGP